MARYPLPLLIRLAPRTNLVVIDRGALVALCIGWAIVGVVLALVLG